MTARTAPAPAPAPAERHLPATSLADRLTARAVRRLGRFGLSLWGSRELRVVGRRSGEVRSTVVNVLEVDGRRYLVAPRGATHWVRNLRAAGEGELRVGRRTEAFRARELADDAKVDVLRAYLERWGWEVGRFFEGVDASSSDVELLAVAPGFPAFAVEAR